MIQAKKQADLDRIIRQFEGTDVQILKGRWGPFITDGNKNARIAKDADPMALSLEECQALLAAAPEKKTRGRKKTAKKAAAKKAGRKKVGKKKTSKKKTGKKATRKKTTGKKKSAGKTPAAETAET